MKRLILALVFSSTAFAAPVTVVNPIDPGSIHGRPYTALDHVPVAPNTTTYSNAYDMYLSGYQGSQITCTGTTPHVQVQLLGSPTIEAADFGLGDGCVDYVGPSPVNVRWDFIPNRFSRLAVVGLADTSPDTICTVWYYISTPVDP